MSPGLLRNTQVHTGRREEPFAQARFVPPPPEFVRDLVEDLCRYIEHNDGLPILVRIAVLHYQLEAIHPFMDGNGRLGRILIPMILHQWGALDQPLLYVSEYFEFNKQEYVDRMLAVSQQGDWKGWILFALDAIEKQANDALLRSQRLLHLREALRTRYQERRNTNLLRIVDLLFERPALTITQIVEQHRISLRQ